MDTKCKKGLKNRFNFIFKFRFYFTYFKIDLGNRGWESWYNFKFYSNKKFNLILIVFLSYCWIYSKSQTFKKDNVLIFDFWLFCNPWNTVQKLVNILSRFGPTLKIGYSEIIPNSRVKNLKEIYDQIFWNIGPFWLFLFKKPQFYTICIYFLLYYNLKEFECFFYMIKHFCM